MLNPTLNQFFTKACGDTKFSYMMHRELILLIDNSLPKMHTWEQEDLIDLIQELRTRLVLEHGY